MASGRCCNASAVWLRPIDPGYFFNPLGEGTLPWVFRRGTGNPPNRVQTPLKQAPEGRGETTKPGATAEPAARQKKRWHDRPLMRPTAGAALAGAFCPITRALGVPEPLSEAV